MPLLPMYAAEFVSPPSLSDVEGTRDLRSPSPPRYSIVIPVKDGWQLTQRAIVSIADRTDLARLPYEIIIADDGSTDQTQRCEVQFPGIRRVVNESGMHGFGPNVNFAAQHADGEVLVLLNNDTEVQEGWLDAIDKTFQESPRVGVVGARLIFPDGRLQEAGCAVFPDGSTRNEGRNCHPEESQFLTSRACDYVSGACLAIRSHLWQELEGFDDLFAPAYYEDVDLCFQVWRKGYSVIYQPDCVVMHIDGGSMKATRVSLAQANLKKFEEKWSSTLELIKSSRPRRTKTFMYSGTIRRLWRSLPLSNKMRSKIVSFVISPPKRTIKRLENRSKPEPGRATVASYLQSAVGIGEAARLDLHALREINYAPAALDLSPAFNMYDLPDWGFGNTILTPGGPLILTSNPLDVPRALGFIGEPALRQRYMIARWAWELPKPPSHCQDVYRFFDELWVCSEYCAQAFREDSPLPVHAVPIPVRKPPTCGKSRRDFGLSDEEVIFLAMADMRSSFDRKNLPGAVKAFVQACGDRPNTRLIIKTHHVDEAPANMERLRKEIGNAENIQIMDTVLSRPEVGDLIRSVDVFLSPHRAEGFGLVMAESMLLGKPVVATNYSGNTDFMTSESAALVDYQLVPVRDRSGIYNYPDQLWAEPDLDQFAQRIDHLAASESARNELAVAAKAHAERHFTVENFAASLSESFRELAIKY